MHPLKSLLHLLTVNISFKCFLMLQMHLDSANGAYCDYGNHTEKVRGLSY